MVKDIVGSAVELETVDGLVPRNWLDQPTPEEAAKYHADQEAAKPIVPYVTRVMHDESEWVVIAPPDPDGDYFLHRIVEGGASETVWAERHEFTVIH